MSIDLSRGGPAAAEVLRSAADALEECRFSATVNRSVDADMADQIVDAWVSGFRRAIFELRALADPIPEIPDDASELAP